jgi:putative membrane protein
MSLQTLTVLSTCCIVLSGISLLIGWWLIRWRRDRDNHRRAKPFAGSGAWRTLYFAILVPHVLLAMAVGPLALRLIQLALSKEDFVAHRRLARVTVPIWLYVAASGWCIYYLLYVRTY